MITFYSSCGAYNSSYLLRIVKQSNREEKDAARLKYLFLIFKNNSRILKPINKYVFTIIQVATIM